METKQIEKEYVFYDIPYKVSLSMAKCDDAPGHEGYYRTHYRFRFTDQDEHDSNFYCFTSDAPEVVFSYIIDAYRNYGKEWKKHLTWDYQSKALYYDGKLMPV